MARKKYYPGGFRLTKKKAAALAVQELGTARGLEAERGMPEGYYHMMIGNLEVRIHPDASNSSFRSSCYGLIQLAVRMNGSSASIVQFFDKDTLEQNFQEEDIDRRAKRREMLVDWVNTNGPEICHKKIDQIWKKSEGRNNEVLEVQGHARTI